MLEAEAGARSARSSSSLLSFTEFTAAWRSVRGRFGENPGLCSPPLHDLAADTAATKEDIVGVADRRAKRGGDDLGDGTAVGHVARADVPAAGLLVKQLHHSVGALVDPPKGVAHPELPQPRKQLLRLQAVRVAPGVPIAGQCVVLCAVAGGVGDVDQHAGHRAADAPVHLHRLLQRTVDVLGRVAATFGLHS